MCKTEWIPAILMGLLLRDLCLLGAIFSAYCTSLSEDIPDAQGVKTPDKTNNNLNSNSDILNKINYSALCTKQNGSPPF